MVVLTKVFYVASVDDVIEKEGAERITLFHLDEARVEQKLRLLQLTYDAINFFFEQRHPSQTQRSPRQWLVDANSFFYREINECHLEHISYKSGEWAGKFVVPAQRYKAGQTLEDIPKDAVKE